MENIQDRIDKLSDEEYVEFVKRIKRKINELPSEQNKFYHEKLDDIESNKYSSKAYGAQDPLNLPDKDHRTIQITLYNQEFTDITEEIFKGYVI